MCPLDLNKYSALKEEQKESSNSSIFRNVAFCTPDSHAEGKGIPLGNLFLNEGDSGDLDNSTITDLGESIEYIYVLDHFQYMEFRDGDKDGDIVFSTIQHKSPFAPIVIRDTVNKEIFALPFWSKEEDSVLKSGRFANTHRSNRYNIYILIKINGEWKRAKIKASASTVYGADFNKETKKPNPHYQTKDRNPMTDSLLGFIQEADKLAGQPGYYKLVKCKLSTAAVGSKNKRISFTGIGLADDAEADMVMKEFLEFKEGVANENASKLSFFTKEQLHWGATENIEYIAAYLQNPLLATYNDTRGISKLLLPANGSLSLLTAAGKSSGQTSAAIVDNIIHDLETGNVSADEGPIYAETTSKASRSAVVGATMEQELERQKEVLKEVDALFRATKE